MCGRSVTCQKPIISHLEAAHHNLQGAVTHRSLLTCIAVVYLLPPRPAATKDRQAMGKRGADRIMVALLATVAVAALAMPQSIIKPFVAEEEYWNDERQLSDNKTQLPESNVTLPNRVMKSDVASYNNTTEMAITFPNITVEAPSMRRSTTELAFQTHPIETTSTTPPPYSTGFSTG